MNCSLGEWITSSATSSHNSDAIAGSPMPPELKETLLPGLADRVVVIESPMLGFSSTEVADRLEAGKSVRYLVPDAVLEYIQMNGLYQNGA